jgi:hypothetical protein
MNMRDCLRGAKAVQMMVIGVMMDQVCIPSFKSMMVTQTTIQRISKHASAFITTLHFDSILQQQNTHSTRHTESDSNQTTTQTRETGLDFSTSLEKILRLFWPILAATMRHQQSKHN